MNRLIVVMLKKIIEWLSWLSGTFDCRVGKINEFDNQIEYNKYEFDNQIEHNKYVTPTPIDIGPITKSNYLNEGDFYDTRTVQFLVEYCRRNPSIDVAELAYSCGCDKEDLLRVLEANNVSSG